YSRRQRLDALPASPEKNAVEGNIAAARQLLDDHKLEEVRRRLGEIDRGIEALRAGRPGAAREGPPAPAQLMLARLPAAPKRPRLVVNAHARDWTTDLPISFELIAPDETWQRGDTFRWYFGDGSRTRDTTEPRASHRYTQPDDYTAKVEVLRGADLDL